eukprot:scaffold2535_cov126-Cylindrotheca_fusiformis.AAC.13
MRIRKVLDELWGAIKDEEAKAEGASVVYAHFSLRPKWAWQGLCKQWDFMVVVRSKSREDSWYHRYCTCKMEGDDLKRTYFVYGGRTLQLRQLSLSVLTELCQTLSAADLGLIFQRLLFRSV